MGKAPSGKAQRRKLSIMAIESVHVHKFEKVVPYDSRGPIDKALSRLLSSELIFTRDGTRLTGYTFKEDHTVEVDAILAPVTMSLPVLMELRQRVNTWAEFIQGELHLPRALSLRFECAFKVATGKTTADLELSVFNPGKQKLTEVTWNATTSLVVFEPRPVIMLTWGDFVQWQYLLDRALKVLHDN